MTSRKLLYNKELYDQGRAIFKMSANICRNKVEEYFTRGMHFSCSACKALHPTPVTVFNLNARFLFNAG